MNKAEKAHEGHEVGTANNVSFQVGYTEDGELCRSPETSKLVKYCYTCDEFLDDEE